MSAASVTWQVDEVKSPHLSSPVAIIAARNVPYVPNANRFQNLSIYTRKDSSTSALVGQSVTAIPAITGSGKPQVHVHIHGGAWRDPNLTSTSAEAFVAHAFSSSGPLNTIISLNYTLSPFPSHPTLPYDPAKTPGVDPSREARHPAHVIDVLHGFELLRSLGLSDGKYLLSGHSAGACLSFQALLQSPSHWGLNEVTAPPTPAVLIGMNGLYDLPALVYGLGESHEHLKDVYKNLIDIAFGDDESKWPAASPALFTVSEIEQGVKEGRCPKIVLIDQSVQDQLVPMNEADRMQSVLEKVPGIKVIRGHRCTGLHAAPWEQGIMIWETVLDVFNVLE